MTGSDHASARPAFSVRESEPLARHLPCRVGGPCDAFIVVHDRDAILDVVSLCRSAGWNRTILGAGTRTVVRDGGLAGAVIRLGSGFMSWSDTPTGAWVGAAIPLAVVGARLAGCQRLLRAPGTLGASLKLDPLWYDVVSEVRYVDRGREKTGPLLEFQKQRNAILCEAHLLRYDTPHNPGPFRPGGWFSPLVDEDVNEVLREAALADTRLRDVMIPAPQPELLVNLGGASAKDLALLQKSVIERVLSQRGVQLENAMHWLGRA